MANTAATADFLAKTLYGKGLDKDALVSENPLLSFVEHSTKFALNGQKKLVIPVPYANSQGIGPTNAIAYASRSTKVGDVFEVPQRRKIHFGEMEADVIRNTKASGNDAQFVDILQDEIDGATANFGQEINSDLYRSNKGYRAKVHASTAPSTTSLTLANPEDAQFFEIGMQVSAVDPANGTVRDSGDYVTLTAIDSTTGVLTASGNWSGISGIAVGDWLVRRGAVDATIDGLDGWCPQTAVTDFLGVNQTLHRERLAGVYYDGSDKNIRNAFISFDAKCKLQIGRKFENKAPLFMNPMDVAQIKGSVEAVRVVSTSVENSFNVGVDAVEILGQTIIEDRHCPVGHAFRVPKGAFTFGTAGNQPELEEIDGNVLTHNRQTGVVEFTLALDGNAYSDGKVNQLARLLLPTRNA